MSRFCPIVNKKVVYLVCQECEEKECARFSTKNNSKDKIFYLMIVGTRTFDNYKLLKEKCSKLLSNYQKVVVVSGGAKGTDALAKIFAHEFLYDYKEFPADWNKYGKSAGPIRNREMCKYISSKEHFGMVAFWDGKSKGTQNDIDLAKEYKIPLRIVHY